MAVYVLLVAVAWMGANGRQIGYLTEPRVFATERTCEAEWRRLQHHWTGPSDRPAEYADPDSRCEPREVAP